MTDRGNATRRNFLQATLATSAVAGLAATRAEAAIDPVEDRARLAADPLRPRYHFLPPAGWTNDPNGPVYVDGRYHLFYQHNPKAAVWGHIQWGHAVSPDMIHWQHLPIALSPTAGGPDADGVFSGTAVIDGDRVHMMYTGVRAGSLVSATIRDADPPLIETQCLAPAADASLLRWTKRAQPVIAAPPPGMVVNGFRDPSPWRQGEWWYMVLGSGIAGQGGAILLYRSRDLIEWQFVHIFAARDPHAFDAFDPWEVWECPDFFALGDRHVLIYSARGKAYWQSGRLDPATMRFEPDRTDILDHGSMYAPKTQLDAQGRRILWGWVQETRPEADSRAAGWSGMMTLPRLLSLDADGAVVQSPLPALADLQGAAEIHRAPPSDGVTVPGCCAEVAMTLDRASPFALAIGDGKTSWLTITRRAERPSVLEIDARQFPLSSDGVGEIRLFVDGSVVEAYVGKRIVWTKRFYYTGPQRDAVLRWSSAGDATVTLWPIKPISPDRLTT